MIKRIEFTLNLDEPREAAIYQALKTALKHRRAGVLIRQALDSRLLQESHMQPTFTTVMASKEESHEQA